MNQICRRTSVLFAALLTIASVTRGEIEYPPIAGELLDYWNTSAPSHHPIITDYDSEKLPDGIIELSIAGIEVDQDSLDIYLLGAAPDTDIPFLLATGGYRGDHNLTKSFVYYSEDEDAILIAFQMPSSSRYCQASYRWNVEEESLVLLRYTAGDPSLEALERADSFMAEGNIAEAIRELDEMFYPYNYFNFDEMTARLLRSINENACKAEAEGNYGDAVNLFHDLAGFLHTDREWFTAFRDSMDYVHSDFSEYMELGEYAMIMNNYAYFLELNNELENSLPVLRQVLDLNPNRMVARLNMADVLWCLGEANEAKEQYNIYKEMMIDRELTNRIPLRVHERTALEPAVPEHFIKSSLLYGNISNYLIDDGTLFASMLGDESDPDNAPGIRAMDISTGMELWFYRTSEDYSSFDSPWDLSVKDSRIYAMVNSSGLHCLDRETGQLVHRFELPDRVIAAYILTENVLYVATITEVIAYDILTRRTLWSFQDQAAPIGMYPTITNQYAYDGMLYIGSISAEVRCLNTYSGKLVWNSNGIMDTGGGGYSNINHVSDNLVFVSTSSGELNLLDRSNGKVLSRVESCNVMAVSNEAVFIYDFDSNQLKALDPENGTVAGEYVPMEEMYSCSVTQCEETICFACENGMLLLFHAIGIEDGPWEPVVIDLADSQLRLAYYEGTIVAASELGNIALIDTNTFEVTRTINTNIEITERLEIYDGSLYFMTGSNLYRLRLDL